MRFSLITPLITVALLLLVLLSACSGQRSDGKPTIELTLVPPEDQGGTLTSGTISGRVTGARPDQRVVLYARSGAWYVQPYADRPFTTIQAD